ncbi:MAG: PAS domain S-box protein [Promethearchaeia archaeon]
MEHSHEKQEIPEKFTQLINYLPDPFFIWEKEDQNLILAGYNRAGYKFSAGMIYDSTDISDVSASSFYEDQPEIVDDLGNAYKKKKKISKKIKYKLKDSKERLYFRAIYTYFPPKYVIMYLHNISELKKKTHKLDQKLKLESILSEISSKFVELKNFDEKINFALRKIGKFVDASRAYLFQLDEEKNTFSNTHEWCAEGISSQISFLQEIPMDDYSWTFTKISKGEVINYPNINNLPPEASAERELFSHQNIDSILYLPVYKGENVVGFIGFDYNISSRKWKKTALNLLKITADIVGNALKQHDIELELRKSKQKLKNLNLELEQKIKQRTEQLRKSEIKFRNLTEHSLMGIFILQDNHVKYVNKTMGDILGYDIEKLHKWTLDDIIENTSPGYRDSVEGKTLKEQNSNTNVINHCTIQSYSKDKEEIWLEVYSKSIQYEDEPATFISVLDITAEKRARQKLKESERDKSIILRSISELIAFQDLDHNIIWTNVAAADSVDYTKAELQGKKCYEIWNNRPTPCENCPVERAVDTGKPCMDETTTYDGRYWELKAYPVENEVGELIGAVEVGKNITELRKIQKSYQESYYHTQLYKDLFAHDISNILQNINTSVDLSKNYMKSPEKRKKIPIFLDIIKEQIVRGTKLVSNVRKLTEFNREEKIKLRKFDLRNILFDAINYIEKSFKSKNLEITTSFSHEDLYVKANNMLQDVFENILINAVRHNDNKLIEINIKVHKITRESTQFIQIEIIDNGIGIKDEIKDKIFQRRKFEQKSGKGMGLGLSLVKRIVNQLNGHIRVENRVKNDYSKGSNFILLIPEYINNG